MGSISSEGRQRQCEQGEAVQCPALCSPAKPCDAVVLNSHLYVLVP